jgi:hypothetical protein
VSGSHSFALRSMWRSSVPVISLEEVLWLAEQHRAVEAERSKLDNHLSDLLSAVGKVAALAPEAASAISRLGADLDPDLARRLNMAVTYFASVPTSAPAGSPDAGRDDS